MAYSNCEYCFEFIQYNPHQSSGRYCDNYCQMMSQHHLKVVAWRLGLYPGYVGKNFQLANFVKRDLRATSGTACQRCGWDERHPVDGGILTEFDHIDGDASNDRPWNLRILCPNCHSMTPTFRARNVQSARKNR